METLAKFTDYSYKRKICLADRVNIVQYYEEGYAISRIAAAVNVTSPTIRHHLQALGILEKKRKVRRWGESIGDRIEVPEHWHLPTHIRIIYRNMYKEDEEIRKRIPAKTNGRKLQHREHSVPSETTVRDKPFVVMYSFTL